MKNYFVATASSKRQFTIPKAIREQLGITPGDRVAITVEDGVMMLTPIGRIGAKTAGSLGKHVRRGK